MKIDKVTRARINCATQTNAIDQRSFADLFETGFFRIVFVKEKATETPAAHTGSDNVRPRTRVSQFEGSAS